jgi:hypothetical protein
VGDRSKKLTDGSDRLAESNERLADSNERLADAVLLLAGVIAGSTDTIDLSTARLRGHSNCDHQCDSPLSVKAKRPKSQSETEQENNTDVIPSFDIGHVEGLGED